MNRKLSMQFLNYLLLVVADGQNNGSIKITYFYTLKVLKLS